MLLLVLSVGLLTPTTASASAESDFVYRTNAARASHGLRAYAVRSDLTSVARRQAARMASAHRIYHNPYLGSEVTNWRSVGENVGKGSSVSAIQNAFMSSSEHRSNILSSTFTEVGIGTARGSDGMLYVSEVFRRPMNAGYVPPPAPRRTVTRRASRSAHRAPLPTRKATVRMPTPTDRLRTRLAAAWRVFRRDRPVASFDRAVIYARTVRLLQG